MIEKVKNISNKKIVVISITIMIIVLVLGFTYAYWTRTFTQSGVNRNTYDCFDINFKEKVEGITIENGYPLIDEEGMQSEAYEVEITNTCNTAASYNVVLNKLNTSTLDSSHIKIAVDNDIRLLSETEEVTSTIENAIEGRIISTGVLPGKESKTLQVRSWMDINTTEEEGSNKVFENKITIEAVATKEPLLAEKILTTPLNQDKADFNHSTPRTIKFAEEKTLNQKINQSLKNINLKQAYVSDDYDFDDETGLYYLKSSVNQNSENIIGKYMCEAGKYSKCNNLYKILEVQKSDSEKYGLITPEEISTVRTSNNDKTLGQDYIFDETTGQFTLTNTVTNVSFGDEYLNYYFCTDNSNSTTCSTLFKIIAVNGTSTSKLEVYKSYKGLDFVTKADVSVAKETTEHISPSGLYKAEDNDGTSYYYRGQIENNYVKFANLLWNITRINGDGTIRLILHPISNTTIYDTNYDWTPGAEKYVGFTYDNSHLCTTANPCDKDSGTSNSMKTYLEKWYDATLKDYDDKIVLGTYCNDTSIGRSEGDVVYYGSTVRINNGTPTFTCPDTTNNYGGLYKLKVGLLSADEAVYAGYKYYEHQSFGVSLMTDNYLTGASLSWLMSPELYEYDFASMNMLNKQYIKNGTNKTPDETYGVRPVINLKANSLVIKGDGTKNNPYVIN